MLVLPFCEMARQEGFEPPASSLEGYCSVRLSYWRMIQNGGSGRIRTPSPALTGPAVFKTGPRTNGVSASKLFGGPDPDRTDDILRARQTLSQLSYRPIFWYPRRESNPQNSDPKSDAYASSATRAFVFWYRHPGSNRDAFQHRSLRPVCLPIPA